MHTFVTILEKGRLFLEEKEKRRKISAGLRWVILPACAVLFFGLWYFRWDFFLASLILPPIILWWTLRKNSRLSLPFVARVLDDNFGLRNLLSTAHEFQKREGESTIIMSLMEDANRGSGLISFKDDSGQNLIEQIIIVSAFFLLLLLNLWQYLQKAHLPPIFQELQSLVSNLKNEDPQKKVLQNQLNNAKSGQTAEQRQEGLQKMKQTAQNEEASRQLKQAGGALQKNPKTQGIGESLQNGQIEKAADQASQLARELGKGLSEKDKKSMEKALQDAQKSLTDSSLKDVKDALNKMEQNLNQPQELEKAVNQLSQKLQDLAIKNQTMEKIVEKIEKAQTELEEGKGNSGGNKTSGQDSAGGKEGNEKGQIDEKTGTAEKKGKPEEKSGQPPLGKDGKESEKNGKNANNLNKQGSEKNPNFAGKGGKSAGGELTEDPMKLLKNGKSKLPKTGELAFDKIDTENASVPQLLPDFEKGNELTDKERLQLKIQQENIAKSREIDEFSQKHRIPPAFRNFLKDFFIQKPASPGN